MRDGWSTRAAMSRARRAAALAAVLAALGLSDRAFAQEPGAGKPAAANAPAVASAPAARPRAAARRPTHVVIISEDGMRPDVFNRQLTPRHMQLMREGT